MGFFSSRRTDEEDEFIVRDQKAGKPVVGIIRSRFYGKAKAKADDSHPIRPHAGKVAHTVTTSIAPDSVADTPVPGRSAPKPAHTASRSPSLPNVRPRPASIYPSPSAPSPRPAPAPKPNNRASANAVTSMLAQRLNELATANAEGLLDDDEYRLLRQNLFERMTAGSDVPQETPVVPIAGPSRIHSHIRDASYGRTPSSLAEDSLRSPSIQSRKSMSSTVSGLVRRAASRKSSTFTDADSASQYSISSVGVRRLFTRKPSNVSISTNNLKSDVMSISPVITQPTPQMPSHSRPHTPGTLSRSTTRSTKRLANAPPPSAFPPAPTPRTPRTNVFDDLLDDAHLKTSADIRAEIEVIEAEGRRLLDAFNGLELSTLTRQARAKAPRTPASAASNAAFVWPPPSSHDLTGKDNSDTLSLRSTTSNGTSLSAHHRSPTRTRPLASSPLVSKPVSLGRKSSVSSASSRVRPSPGTGPPMPPLLTSLGVVGSSSSVNLSTRSATHLPLAPVAERDSMDDTTSGHSRQITSPGRRTAAAAAADDEDAAFAVLEAEMADIRRRRAEVMSRYDERLEYLRAKLKGAELHEKLLRK